MTQSVQEKIIDDRIPVGKALALVTLTREHDADASSSFKQAGVEAVPWTERYYEEIEVLAREIEKGSKGEAQPLSLGAFSSVILLPPSPSLTLSSPCWRTFRPC